MENGSLVKVLDNINRVDNIIQTSPSAQMLVNNASRIINCFQQVKLAGMQYQQELEKMRQNRAQSLQKYEMNLPAMHNILNTILQSIFLLQAKVRDQARVAYGDKNAETVISYTNMQVEQNIQLFQNLTFQLLNS